MTCSLKFALLALAAGFPAAAQVIEPQVGMYLTMETDDQGHYWGNALVQLSTARTIVATAPFSAEEVLENRRILADGIHLGPTGPKPSRIFRDNQGWTRLERPISNPAPEAPFAAIIQQIQIIEIDDPVGGVFYLADPQKKVVYRMPYKPTAGIPRAPLPTGPGITVKIESLGQKLVEGVLAEGERRVTTFAVGTRGNDRPMDVVREVWRVHEGRLPVFLKDSSATGEAKLELRGVSLASPPAALFEPPAGFAIRDVPQASTQPFSMELGDRPPGAKMKRGSGGGAGNLLVAPRPPRP
jgi:hypothetical protein